MDYGKIGNYIKNKRKKLHITQDELGEVLGVTGKAVSKWECGSAMPDVSLFIPLSDILKIEVSELLNGEDRKDNLAIVRKRKKILMSMLIIVTVASVIFTIIMGIYYRNNYDKVHIYKLSSENKSFFVNGEIISINDKNYISIYNVGYLGKEVLSGNSIKYELCNKSDKIFEKSILEISNNDEEDSIGSLLDFITFSTRPINYEKFSNLILKFEIRNDSDDVTNFSIKLKVE